MAPHSSIDVEVEGIRDTEGIAIPNPLILDAISARRLKAGKLVAGIAALASSDQFKSSVCHGHGHVHRFSCTVLTWWIDLRKAKGKTMGS